MKQMTDSKLLQFVYFFRNAQLSWCWYCDRTFEDAKGMSHPSPSIHTTGCLFLYTFQSYYNIKKLNISDVL